MSPPMHLLAKCPLAKCPLAKCPLVKWALAKCPGFINTAACSFSRSLSPLGFDSRQHTWLTAKYLSLTWRLSFLTEAQLLYMYVDYSFKNGKMVVFVDIFTRLEFVIWENVVGIVVTVWATCSGRHMPLYTVCHAFEVYVWQGGSQCSRTLYPFDVLNALLYSPFAFLCRRTAVI